MEHHVDIVRTDNEDPQVPAAFHATCACGWAAESHDEAELRALATDHEHGSHEIPVPAAPSPVRLD